MGEIDIHVIPPQKYPRSIAEDISDTVALFEIIRAPITGSLKLGPIWVSFMSNVSWYPIFQTGEEDPTDIPDPDPDARGTDEHQCFRIPANFELQRKIDERCNNFKVLSLKNGVLRWHIASFDNSGTV